MGSGMMAVVQAGQMKVRMAWIEGKFSDASRLEVRAKFSLLCPN